MNESFRPINYLGSKLRILHDIEQEIDRLDPERNPICDLFAGSGTVSNYLAQNRAVISVDIQEYSRVLCSALLNDIEEKLVINDIYMELVNKDLFERLYSIFEPLIIYENKCINDSLTGINEEDLCCFLENFSIYEYETDPQNIEQMEVKNLIEECMNRMNRVDLKEKYTITKYYGGIYFSVLQAIEIDVVLNSIDKIKGEIIRDKCLAAVISSASDIVNTVGKQFAQPIKPRDSNGNPKKNLGNRVNKDRKESFFNSFKKWLNVYLDTSNVNRNLIYKMDYLQGINSLNDSVKVIYADPPYTRYHYSRYYHVLETICLHDEPIISKVKLDGKEKISKGVYRTGRHQSPFCIKTQAKRAFETMISAIAKKNKKLILSYSPHVSESKSTPRLMQISQIIEIAEKYFENVEMKEVSDITHNKLNSRERNYEINCPAEVLISCW